MVVAAADQSEWSDNERNVMAVAAGSVRIVQQYEEHLGGSAGGGAAGHFPVINVNLSLSGIADA